MTRTRRWLTAGSAALIAITAIVTLVAPNTAQAVRAARTSITNVSPVTQSGALKHNYRVTERHSGAQCLVNDDGTNRCFAGNFVYDPCFPSFRQGRWSGTYCLYYPWRHAVVRLTGHEEHSAGTHASRFLWGLQLRSGQRCVLQRGMSEIYHGRRLNFSCPHNLWLAGMPTKRFAQWRIRAVTWTSDAQGHNHYTHPYTARITRAWYEAYTRPKPPVRSFANCTALRETYPHGVGRPGAVDSTSGTPVTNFYRSAALYNANSRLDRDRDGIACEKH